METILLQAVSTGQIGDVKIVCDHFGDDLQLHIIHRMPDYYTQLPMVR